MYEYYDGSNSFGSSGDLMRVAFKKRRRGASLVNISELLSLNLTSPSIQKVLN